MRLAQSILFAASIVAFTPAVLHAQTPQDGLVAFPDIYTVQFENDYVRLIRVRLPGSARLAEHTHPPGIMLHVYFNDADPVQFNHDGPPHDVTRPPVQARSYRVGPATPESHSVNNMGIGMSDYMRVELKTQGDERWRARIPATALVDTSSTIVEVNNRQYRSSRITIASGQAVELSAAASQPFILLALTNGIAVERAGAPARVLTTGDEHFISESGRATIRNTSTSPVQLLRVDFLSKPLE